MQLSESGAVAPSNRASRIEVSEVGKLHTPVRSVRALRGVVATVAGLALLVTALLLASSAIAAPEAPELTVTAATATSATFVGVVNPKAGTPSDVGNYYFVYRESSSGECRGEGQRTTPPNSGGFYFGGEHEQLPAAPVYGLLAETEYAVCLVLQDEEGETESAPVTFRTTRAPTVANVGFHWVGSSSATVTADLETGGYATSYRVEFGPTSAYGSSTPEQDVGAGGGIIKSQIELSGLQSRTTYHFRLVATNSASSTEGTDTTLTTLAPGLTGLPDGRAYEMVTPVSNNDGDVEIPFQGFEDVEGNQASSGETTTDLPFQAAESGEAVTYVGSPSPGGAGGKNQYMARRLADSGWAQTVLQPHGYQTPTYQAFSNDLGVGILSSCDRSLPPLAPGAPGEGYSVLYERSTSTLGYAPLFTGTPSNRTAYEFGSAFVTNNGGVSNCSTASLTFAGASANFDDKLFLANGKLTPEAPEGTSTENNLYESVGGRLGLVNILPDGTAQANATYGAPSETAGEGKGGPRSSNPPDFDNVISADGSRVFWSSLDGEGRPTALYMRENPTMPQSPLGKDGTCTIPADACTVQIDASQNPGVSGSGGRYWTATSAGTVVFFTDEARLTPTSTAAPGAPDLYEYDVTDDHLTDLTIDTRGGEHADVKGLLGASEDGRYVYYVASGALAEGADSRICENQEQLDNRLVEEFKVGRLTRKAEVDQLESSREEFIKQKRGEPSERLGCNLYVQIAGGPPRFIAALSVTDGFEAAPAGVSGAQKGEVGAWQPALGHRTAEVTPDGRAAIFSSNLSLTGYSASAGKTNVFRYDATRGQLACVSCLRSGAPAPPTLYQAGAARADAFFPVSWSDTYQPRAISSDGTRVFFDSLAPLVPQDTSGNIGVYEWESDGAGSCREASGCQYLLSDGASTASSYLVDASADGDDVFIASRAGLTLEDSYDAYKLFDVRVNGVSPIAPPACSGTGCQGVAPSAPIFATPPSVTFEGGGGNYPSPAPAKVKSAPRRSGSAGALAKELRRCKAIKHQRSRRSCEARARKHHRARPAAQRMKSSARGGH